MAAGIGATPKDIRLAVAFTGYRPQKLSFHDDLTHPDAIRLRESLRREYEKMILKGYTQFLTGGALGCDLMAAEVILQLGEEYNRFRRKGRLHHFLCLPCRNHTAKWSEAQKERLSRIEHESTVIYVNDTDYFKGCMQARNEYMVDTSSVLLAVYDGQPGGTRNTLVYAQKKKKKTVIINPKFSMRIELFESPKDIEDNLCFIGDDDEEDDE